ncbi:APC family permease [bacterium]|nr:APC family permease [bacterium]
MSEHDSAHSHGEAPQASPEAPGVDGSAPGGTQQLPRNAGARIMHMVFGKPLASSVALDHRLPILLALPVFASDALSSVAYATEEVLHVLASHNSSGSAISYLLPISVAITMLMFIVAFSYRRAILLYPTSGGSYTVSRKNLGAMAGLVAGAALFIDYILTVAVSVSAGVAALTSYLPQMYDYRVYVGLALILVIAWINLRGVKESGWTFALPAYTFMFSILVLIGGTLYKYLTGTLQPLPVPPEAIQAVEGLGWFALLKAFSNGCSALTGVEAVSNGVQSFQQPEAKNAARTLVVLILSLVVLFIGVGWAASAYHVVPTHTETVISQIAGATFGKGSFFYLLVMISTLSILLVASNTAFAGLPALLAMMARDGYAPRVLLSQGDRLVYNRGIFALTVISALLIIIFKASVTLLIPLYAVGVFLCFTLSQAGMLRRMLVDKQPGWVGGAAVNALGAFVTGVVTLVIAVSKFHDGAWLVCLLIPLLVFIGYKIKKHYQWFQNRLDVKETDTNPLLSSVDHLTVVVLVSSDIHRGTLEGLEAARAFVEGRSNSELRALHIELDPAKTKRLKDKWDALVVPYLGHLDISLDIVPSPYRWLVQPVLAYLDSLDRGRQDHRVVVLLAEFETGSVWTQMLHNQSTLGLRKALFNRPNVTIITNRFFLKPGAHERRGLAAERTGD